MFENFHNEEKRNADQIWAIAVLKEKEALKVKQDKVLVQKDWSYWSLCYALFALVICIVFTIPITLIPQHNVIESPEYWYEMMIPTTLCVLLYWSILAIMRFKVFFEDIKSLASVKTWLVVFLAFAVPYNIAY